MNERTRMFAAFAAGLAAGASLPIVAPAVAEAGRPVAKALIKHGILALEREGQTKREFSLCAARQRSGPGAMPCS